MLGRASFTLLGAVMDDWTDGEMDGSLVLPTKTTKGFESDGGDGQTDLPGGKFRLWR